MKVPRKVILIPKLTMKIWINILLSIFIIIEVCCMILRDILIVKVGIPVNVLYVLYYFNQSILIIGLLIYLKGYLNNILLNIIICLSIVKVLYNVVYLYDKNLADKVNNCYYFGFVITISIVLSIICRKRR